MPPGPQDPGLQMNQGRASDNEKQRPREPPDDSKTRQEQLGASKAQKYSCHKVGRGSKRQVHESRYDRSCRSDKVLSGIIWRADRTEPDPCGDIFGCVGDQCQK